jgi:hypothetical protein
VLKLSQSITIITKIFEKIKDEIRSVFAKPAELEMRVEL